MQKERASIPKVELLGCFSLVNSDIFGNKKLPELYTTSLLDKNDKSLFKSFNVFGLNEELVLIISELFGLTPVGSNDTNVKSKMFFHVCVTPSSCTTPYKKVLKSDESKGSDVTSLYNSFPVTLLGSVLSKSEKSSFLSSTTTCNNIAWILSFIQV